VDGISFYKIWRRCLGFHYLVIFNVCSVSDSFYSLASKSALVVTILAVLKLGFFFVRLVEECLARIAESGDKVFRNSMSNNDCKTFVCHGVVP
jgi:hypothetical protein